MVRSTSRSWLHNLKHVLTIVYSPTTCPQPFKSLLLPENYKGPQHIYLPSQPWILDRGLGCDKMLLTFNNPIHLSASPRNSQGSLKLPLPRLCWGLKSPLSLHQPQLSSTASILIVYIPSYLSKTQTKYVSKPQLSSVETWHSVNVLWTNA